MTNQQQIIGNTVYRVGQEIATLEEALPLIKAWTDEWNSGERNYVFSKVGVSENWMLPRLTPLMFPIKIQALPNPDPDSDTSPRQKHWREVVLKPLHVSSWSGVFYNPFHSLQFAVQEVCKADGAKKVVLPDWHPYYTPAGTIFEKRLDPMDVQIVMTCLLLGGRVFVKGGV